MGRNKLIHTSSTLPRAHTHTGL